MGLDAQLIATGPFHRDLVPFLEYPAERYDAVPEGATIVTTVHECVTSDESGRLARAFGVGAMELHRHALDPGAADLALLEAVGERRLVDAFSRLRDAGFRFYYLPNA